MRIMMLADFLALAKSLSKWALLYALLALGICLVFGSTPALILLLGFPLSHTVLATMLMRDRDRGWNAFRQALPLSRADVVKGRYATTALVVSGCVALGAAAYAASCTLNAVVPGLPLIGHFAQGFDVPGLVSFIAVTFALTLTAFGLSLPFLFSDSHRKAINYVPLAFVLAIFAWIYVFRSVDFEPILPAVGEVLGATQTLGGSLLVGACAITAALALYVVSERVALRVYAPRDL